jgi:hypothetical protein
MQLPKIGTEARLAALQILTALAITLVRHDLQKPRVPWESLWSFCGVWFVHYMALVLLTVFAGAMISGFEKRFLGYQRVLTKDRIEELTFEIAMTVLVATVCIFAAGHYVPTDDY